MTADEKLVRDALATHTSDFELLGGRLSNDHHVVREVGFEGQRAVCKFARNPDDVTGLHRGALLLRRLADSDAVPAPRLLARGEDHYVASFASGGEYDGDVPRDVRERRLRDAGATLARVHDAFEFEAHGELRPANDRLKLDARESWSDLFAESVADWSDAIDEARFADLGRDVRAFVRNHPDAFEGGGAPVLVHGDYEADNVRFAEDGVSSILDWEVARSGPGEFDLVRAELGWFENTDSPESDRDLRDALFAGYESVRPLRDGFGLRRAVYWAALMLRPLRDVDGAHARTDVSVDELAAVVEPFVRDRLDAARERLQ